MCLSEDKLRFVCFMRRKLGFCECDVSEGRLILVLCMSLTEERRFVYLSFRWRDCYLYVCD
jgi:hypothetical protein